MSVKEIAHRDLNEQLHTLHNKLVGIGNALSMFAIGGGLEEKHVLSIEFLSEQITKSAARIDEQQSRLFALGDQLGRLNHRPSPTAKSLHSIADELDCIHSRSVGIGDSIKVLSVGLAEITDISTGGYLAIDFLGEQVLEASKTLNKLQSNALFAEGFGYTETRLGQVAG